MNDLESDWYDRHGIDHAISYANGHVHTNGLENFWSLSETRAQGNLCECRTLPSAIWMSRHFLCNLLKQEKSTGFVSSRPLPQFAGKRLTYAKLIDLENKDGDSLPPTTGTWRTVSPRSPNRELEIEQAIGDGSIHAKPRAELVRMLEAIAQGSGTGPQAKKLTDYAPLIDAAIN